MSSANDPPSPAFYFPTCCVDAKFVVLNCVLPKDLLLVDCKTPMSNERTTMIPHKDYKGEV